MKTPKSSAEHSLVSGQGSEDRQKLISANARGLSPVAAVRSILLDPLCPVSLEPCREQIFRCRDHGCLESDTGEPLLAEACGFCKQRIAVLYCDGEIEPGGATCDKPICKECGTHVGRRDWINSSMKPDLFDLCPECIALDRDFYERRMLNEKREAWRAKNLHVITPKRGNETEGKKGGGDAH